jgi:cyclase
MIKRIIAKLDVKSSNVVKGVNLEGLRVLGKTWDFADYYYKNDIDELIYQDVVASLYGQNSLYDLIEKTAKNIFIPLTVGGGISSNEEIYKILRSGADKVSINSAAIKNPKLIYEASKKFGSSTIVSSIELKNIEGHYFCFYENGRSNSGMRAEEWIYKLIKLGTGEIILTFIDSEGTGKGIDCKFLKKIDKISEIPFIINGGFGNEKHVKEVLSFKNINGAAISSLFHYDLVKKIKLKSRKIVKNEEGNLDFLNNYYKSSDNIKSQNIKSLKKFLFKNKIQVRLTV